MENKQAKNNRLSTAEVARMAGVHKDTLLRWLKVGHVLEPGRDRHGWRCFTASEANAIVGFAHASGEAEVAEQSKLVAAERRAPYLGNLAAIDWDFAGAKTSYLTHGLHPYWEQQTLLILCSNARSCKNPIFMGNCTLLA